VEATAVWIHPERGELPPDDFLPLADETGLIGRLGDWMLREACSQAAAWWRMVPGDRCFGVAVDLSHHQLGRIEELTSTIREALGASGLPASALVLEVPEDAVMRDPRTGRERVVALHGIGVRIAIDRFGTGASAPDVLRDLPIEILKFDRSVAEAVTGRPSETALVRALLSLGSVLGPRVLVEGIRTREQSAALQAMGCELGQGPAFARALPAAEVRNLLTADSCPASLPGEREPELVECAPML
jgi:EAL domain-containing protein (putative c-di-GMP-specific phosphodiesterase class I)